MKEQCRGAWGLGRTMNITPMECAIYLKIVAEVGISGPVLCSN